MNRKLFRFGLLFLVLVLPFMFLPGCQTLGYYAQAMNGQLGVWHASRPIDKLIESNETKPELRARLELVSDIRAFASAQLDLPDNDSYRKYADLGRPYVLWNVFAAPELSLKPQTWCFPFAGCVAYRGYFSQEGAEKFAGGLREQKLDVFVGGVAAYSTLGWFDDPVLNTFIDYADTELARLVFHELAHQVAYAPGDTVFNESFATAVELEGVRRWLDHSGKPEMFAAFKRSRARYDEFLDLVAQSRMALQQIYASEESDDVKRVQKAQAFDRMREAYVQMKARWGGYNGFDNWFANSLNNAKLGSIAAYNELVPAFQRLLEQHHGELGAFYAAVRDLAERSDGERRAGLGVMQDAEANQS